MMETMDIDKMKVAELRQELSNRNLDTKGTKAYLQDRLRKAIQAHEDEDDDDDTPPATTSTTTSTQPLQQSGNDPEDSSEDPAPAAEGDSSTVEENVETSEQSVEESAEASEHPMEEQTENHQDDVKEKNEENNKEEKETDKKDDDDVSAHVAEATASAAATFSSNTRKQQRRGQKRGRGNNALHDDEQPYVVTEDEPEIDSSALVLDWFNSDLNLRIDKETFMKAEPFFKDGWGYVWAGAKATYGFQSGKIGFQVKLLENMDSRLTNEKELHELRIGFSTDEMSMQLGESLNSFAYSGSGKKATNGTFEDYGVTFAKDDVVGAYLDLDSDPATIVFTKNEESQEVAFTFPKSQLEDKALFPHISSRNIKFEVNFGKSLDGSDTEPFFPCLDGYVFAASYENRIPGPSRIKTRAECEMIMMIGLPAAGKTTWVNKHVEENQEKRYNVIGANVLIDKMKVNGEPRKSCHEGRWELLTQKCTRCLQDWLRLASQRRRNVVIDQTNVYPNAQKRKIRPFEGMIRKAVVIVPSENDYKSRVEAEEKAGNKDVPDIAVLEMKAHFTLPIPSGVTTTTVNSEGVEETKEYVSPFSDIVYPELEREDALKIVEEYNKTAKEMGYGKKQENRNKRLRGNNFRMNNRSNGGGNHRMRGRNHPGRFRSGPPPPMPLHFRGPNRFFRGGPPPPMRGVPPMRGGGAGPFMPAPLMRSGPMNNRSNGPPGGQNRQHFGKNNGGGRNQWRNNEPVWNQWSHSAPPPPQSQGWGPWNQMNRGDGWRNQRPSPMGGNNQGNFGGSNFGGGNFGSNWGNNPSGGYNNQGYPGNSNWGGGGGYGGR